MLKTPQAHISKNSYFIFELELKEFLDQKPFLKDNFLVV